MYEKNVSWIIYDSLSFIYCTFSFLSEAAQTMNSFRWRFYCILFLSGYPNCHSSRTDLVFPCRRAGVWLWQHILITVSENNFQIDSRYCRLQKTETISHRSYLIGCQGSDLNCLKDSFSDLWGQHHSQDRNMSTRRIKYVWLLSVSFQRQLLELLQILSDTLIKVTEQMIMTVLWFCSHNMDK